MSINIDFDPLSAIKSELSDIETRVRVAVETAILRELTRSLLSRLITLDANRARQYQESLDAIGAAD